MNKMRIALVTFALVCAGGVLAAPTVYVDQAADAETENGTAEHPYTTIQKGVSNVDANGTVYVAPGVYATGEEADSDNCLNRVKITKTLTLVASSFEETGCRTNTVIRGRAATSPLSSNVELGLGDDAVRCIRATAANVVVRGFTLEDGHSRYDNNGGGGLYQNMGGAVYGNTSCGTRIEDCVIRNCAATRGGAFMNCRVVRCFVTGCNSSNVGVCFRNTDVYNAIVARNGFLGGNGLGAYTSGIYNSTIVENATGVWQDSGAVCCNCAIFQTALGSLKDKEFQNCVTDNDWADYSHDGACSTATYESCCYSPLANDFRVLSGSALAAHGSTAAAQLTNGGAYDIFGNARKTNDATMNIGAVEAVVTSAAGDVVFAPTFTSFTGASWANGGNQAVFGPVTIGSKPSFLREQEGSVGYPSSFRLQFPARLQTGYLYATASDGVESVTVLPMWNGTIDLPRLPIQGGTPTAYTAITTKNIFYVERDVNENTGGTGTAADPFRSLQEAAAKAATISSGYCLVYVKGGDYNNGSGTSVTGTGTWPCRLAFSANTAVRFVAVDGPTATVIRGDSGTRCAAVNVSTGKSFVLSGFTLADGHTAVDLNGWIVNDQRGGAAYRTSGGAFWLSDCTITGCEAKSGLLYDAWAMRCRFVDSLRNDGSVAISSRIVSSLITGCGPASAGNNNLIGSSVYIQNTTIGGTTSKTGIGIANAQNSVIDQIYGSYDVNGSGILEGGTFKYSLARVIIGAPQTGAGGNQEGSVFGAPACFAAVASGDLRLLACSKARGLAKFDQMWKGCPTDVYGNPFVGTPEGRFTAGAIEATVPGAAFETSYANGVQPTEPQPFDAEGVIEVTSTALTRPLRGYEVNGELIATTNRVWKLLKADYPGVEGFTVRAVYSSEFWADAVNGKETNSGFYENDAKKYIRSALALADAGDTVVACPGDYDADEELSCHTTGAEIQTRVVVPDGYTLRSRDGAAATRIVGAVSPNPTRLGRLGPGAIRCVYLERNAVLEGFTLVNGNTAAPAEGTGDDVNDRRGGGVLGENLDRCVVQDCIITNCASLRGGGVAQVTCRRCRIVGNTGVHMGTGVFSARLHRCFADHNTGNLMWLYQGSVDGCTIGAHNYQYGTTCAKTYIETTGASAYIRNSIILGGEAYSTSSNIYDCVLAPGATAPRTNELSRLVLNAVPLDFEVDGVTPKIGANVAIDRGDAASMPEADLARDLLGSTQIWNNAPDIGAVEADWRDHYARSLSGNRLVVDDVPATAHEELDRRVRLREGKLEMSWRPTARGPATTILSYSVPGTGTLVVYLNGEVVGTAAAGETKQYVYRSPVGTDKLAFVYEPGVDDDLGALLGGFSGTGMTINFR